MLQMGNEGVERGRKLKQQKGRGDDRKKNKTERVKERVVEEEGKEAR